jgi:hypothetical protein
MRMTIDRCFPADAAELDAARELGEQLWGYLGLTHTVAEQSWPAILMALMFALHNSLMNLDASTNLLDYFDTITAYERARLEQAITARYGAGGQRVM